MPDLLILPSIRMVVFDPLANEEIEFLYHSTDRETAIADYNNMREHGGVILAEPPWMRSRLTMKFEMGEQVFPRKQLINAL